LNQFTPTPEKIDVQDMVNQLFKLQATAVQQKNIVLHNQIIPQHMPYTDANMLAIVIRNIMANVVKHAAPNSHLTISSQQDTNISLSFVNQLQSGSDVATLTYAHQPVVGSSIHGLGTTLIREFTAKMGGTVQYHLHADELTTELCLPAATHQTL
jgi:K+-sensing histidine kinase KdpD